MQTAQFSTKVAAAASTENSRYAITSTLVASTPEGGTFAVSTNGKVLTAVRGTSEGGAFSTLVPSEVIGKAPNGVKLSITDKKLTASDITPTGKVSAKTRTGEPPEGGVPPCLSVIPTLDECSYLSVSFSPDQLALLAALSETESVTLFIPLPNSLNAPAIVQANGYKAAAAVGDTGIGCIMLCVRPTSDYPRPPAKSVHTPEQFKSLRDLLARTIK